MTIQEGLDLLHRGSNFYVFEIFCFEVRDHTHRLEAVKSSLVASKRVQSRLQFWHTPLWLALQNVHAAAGYEESHWPGSTAINLSA